jgi:hypothetical protein
MFPTFATFIARHPRYSAVLGSALFLCGVVMYGTYFSPQKTSTPIVTDEKPISDIKTPTLIRLDAIVREKTDTELKLEYVMPVLISDTVNEENSKTESQTITSSFSIGSSTQIISLTDKNNILSPDMHNVVITKMILPSDIDISTVQDTEGVTIQYVDSDIPTTTPSDVPLSAPTLTESMAMVSDVQVGARVLVDVEKNETGVYSPIRLIYLLPSNFPSVSLPNLE